MVEFNLWKETFIFAMFFCPIVIIPCVLVALMGRKMIDQLGLYPSKTPIIQMSIFYKLIFIEVITFLSLVVFYHFFSGK